MVFVWHRSLAFRIFAWLLGIGIRIGFARRGNGSFLTHSVEENLNIHEIYEYLSTLKPLGIESSETNMDLALSEEEKSFAVKIMGKNGSDLLPGYIKR